jgi:sterol desaturase/sphingolipid hydroxylase (fatty acid hydroxylase superfamily)
MLSAAIRYGAYPVIFGACAMAVLVLAGQGVSPWPSFAAVAAAGIAAVALLERVQPYETAWLTDHNDTAADAIHLLVNLGLLSGTAYLAYATRGLVPATKLWPEHWPLWVQVLLAGTIIDVGLYAMHRLSHRFEWLWRLHAPHHSSERLYWMNGERRHPVSALCLAGPGILAVVTLGATPLVITAWLTILAVHLAFQHSNIDYRLGVLRHVLGVAEVHRWHHKREYEDAQVNFGEFWMLWDRLFGTFLDQPQRVGAASVGLREETMPHDYLGQLVWPFRRRKHRLITES